MKCSGLMAKLLSKLFYYCQVAQEWVKVLHEEYFKQSDTESRQGLPSSKMMDK